MGAKRYPQIIHTWMYGNVDFTSVARSIGETGAEGADLAMTAAGPHNSPAALAKVDVKGILERENLGLYCATLQYNRPDVDLSHPDPAIRAAGLDFARRGLDVTAANGCDRMMVTPSWFSVKHALHGTYAEDFARGAESVAIIAEEAEKRGVRLLVEAINRFRNSLVNTVADAQRLIAMVGHNLGIVADTYHMNMEEDQSVASTILTAAGQLGCLHIGENNRKPPGFGSLDWKSIILALRSIGYEGPLSHEPLFRGFDENRVAAEPAFHRRFQDMLIHGVKTLDLIMEATG